MSNIRSFAERQDATFAHKPVERIVWQPRFSDWYHQNHIYNLKKSEFPKAGLICPDLPQEVYGMELDEVYAYLDASPRYPGEGFPGLNFFFPQANPDAKIEHKHHTDEHGNRFHKIITPLGELTESWRAGSSYPDERILKSKEDIPAVLYYLDNTTTKAEFSQEGLDFFYDIVQGRCVASVSPWRSPYNKCIVELAGTKRTMILMKRYTREFDNFCDELARINFERIMPPLIESPIPYLSMGDNVDCMNNPPYVYEKYILPYFQQIAKECKRVGKYTFAHYDGHLRDLLPYFGNDIYPFDGIEAPTFKPQGDVTIEEFRKALGDRIIVLDGIPSTIFLPHFTDQYFDEYVQKVLELFSPNLILGVSDEYSPNGLFSRLKRVASIVEKFEP